MIEYATTVFSTPQFIELVIKEHRRRRRAAVATAAGLDPDDVDVEAEGPEDDDLAVPSEEWVRMAFAPSNPFNMVCAAEPGQTGRIQMCRAIQKRIDHKADVDDHYTLAIRKYVKHEAILARKMLIEINSKRSLLRLKNESLEPVDLDIDEVYVILSADDKAKIPVGAPGHPIVTKVKQ